ncbi:7443_t:CDS:2 [Funneliformis mosseae]|uniref:7443_t:CDS:1 n=1 Tax=Funneliformis mosseae TaxID=27381 RepID=A0A9N8ZQI6_FUNMO|nr:7443_t:CDS:2 [Funneliformis mosseae]
MCPSHLQEKIIQLNVLFKESDTVIDDLQATLVDFLLELQKDLDLDFVQVERIRQYLNDRGTLFRFLRRAGFDFDSALRTLKSDLRWRVENNVDTISLADVHPLFVEKGLFFFHKTDKFGRPCAVFNLREYKRDDGSPTIEEVKKFIIYNAEVARRMLLDRTRESRDGPVLQYVILLDLKGAGVSTLDLELVPFTIDIMRHHFPGSAGSIFILNYGWMYSGIWQIVKRILPEESLNRIFFPSEKEIWNYFDEENVLIEQGGKDTYEYDSETCEAFRFYGNPSPVLQIPLSRATSFDSLHDVFYSAHNTPFHSRPSTPFFSRPATPHGSRPGTPVSSRPASPGLDHVAVPNWLKMTPLSPMASPNLRFTVIDQEVPALTSHNPLNQHLPSITPICKTTNEDNDSHFDLHHTHHVHFQVDENQQQLQHPNDDDGSSPTHRHNYLSIIRSRSVRRVKLFFTRLLRRLIARRVSGFLYYLVMVVLLRGGLMDEFLRLVTQQVTMQLSWNASTATNLTTALLSAALSGRNGNRLLRT